MIERIKKWYEKNYTLVVTILLIAFTVAVGFLLSWWLSQVKIV